MKGWAGFVLIGAVFAAVVAILTIVTRPADTPQCETAEACMTAFSKAAVSDARAPLPDKAMVALERGCTIARHGPACALAATWGALQDPPMPKPVRVGYLRAACDLDDREGCLSLARVGAPHDDAVWAGLIARCTDGETDLCAALGDELAKDRRAGITDICAAGQIGACVVLAVDDLRNAEAGRNAMKQVDALHAACEDHAPQACAFVARFVVDSNRATAATAACTGGDRLGCEMVNALVQEPATRRAAFAAECASRGDATFCAWEMAFARDAREDGFAARDYINLLVTDCLRGNPQSCSRAQYDFGRSVSDRMLLDDHMLTKHSYRALGALAEQIGRAQVY